MKKKVMKIHQGLWWNAEDEDYHMLREESALSFVDLAVARKGVVFKGAWTRLISGSTGRIPGGLTS